MAAICTLKKLGTQYSILVYDSLESHIKYKSVVFNKYRNWEKEKKINVEYLIHIAYSVNVNLQYNKTSRSWY